MNFVGIDLSWIGTKPTAIATGKLYDGRLNVTDVACDVMSLDEITNHLDGIPELTGIAIDAPLVITNQTGQRECEKLIGRTYGKFGASCHTSNLKLFPNSLSVELAHRLGNKGYSHIKGDKWQIECYPHPAIINLFNLDYRLPYKKGLVATKKTGQVQLGNYINQLKGSDLLPMTIDDAFSHITNSEFINTLSGKSLKANEDALDSLICLYTAALHHLGKCQVFGDSVDSYICVPNI